MSWEICPKCGLFGFYSQSNSSCKFCQNENLICLSEEDMKKDSEFIRSLSPVELEKYVKFEDCDDPKDSKQRIAIAEYRRQKYAYNSPLFDKQKYEERIAWEKARNFESDRKRQRAEKQIRCPHCGCTEFQMVPRKWSLFAGLLTNKVDRVCVKCKKRF